MSWRQLVGRYGRRPQYLSISEWAERHRMLGVESQNPGRWRNEKCPYLVEIMDACMLEEGVGKVVTVLKSAQSGGTETANNVVGYYASARPENQMFVTATEDMAREDSNGRIQPMLDALNLEVKGNALKKSYPGGVLYFRGSNSPAGLKSKSLKVVVADEEGNYETDLKGQGSVFGLLLARFNAAREWLILRASTPTLHGTCPITKGYEDSDRRQWWVTFPCGHEQVLSGDGLVSVYDEHRNVTDAYMSCAECGYRLEEKDKGPVIRGGEWRAGNPGHQNRGYHVTAFMSLLGGRIWLTAARARELGKTDTAAEKTYRNTFEGLAYRPLTSAPDWQELRARRRWHEMEQVADGVGVLTAGVDVQGDRLEMVVMGWGERMQSWVVDWKRFEGRTDEPEVWERMERRLLTPYRRADGRAFTPLVVCVDSGHKTHSVFEWTRKARANGLQWLPIKGQAHQKDIIGTAASLDIVNSKSSATGQELHYIGVNVTKEQLAGWLANKEGQRGFVHFPQQFHDEERFFRGVASEEQVYMVDRMGMGTWRWRRVYKNNEPWDCMVYARAGAALEGVDYWSEDVWRVMVLDGAIGSRRTRVGGISR